MARTPLRGRFSLARHTMRSTMHAQILILGSVNRDLIVHAPRLPHPGETLRGQRFSSCLGGKGANQAVAAARLGARVALAARIGLREQGGLLLEQLRAEGVDLRWVQQAPDETPGVALIVVGAENGENQIVTVAGSNAMVGADLVEHLPLGGLRWLVAQQELPIPALRRAFGRAREAGVRTLLNAAPFREDGRELLALCDLLVVNEGEAAALLGRSEPPDAAAASLRGLGPEAVLISLGAAGCVWADAQRTLSLPAPAVQAVDTVGAGDTLVGALVTALTEGQALPEALRFAQAAAAWAVARPGVQDAMPHRVELQDWLAEPGA